MVEEITLVVNGKPATVQVEPRRLLADVLREELRLPGTHVACGYGVCGACTVLLDGEPIRSCLMFAVQAAGRRVPTVGGLVAAEHLHPLHHPLLKDPPPPVAF